MSVPTEPMLLPSPASLLFGKIHQGDCLEQMRQIESGTIDLAFADPPFNIGYEYDEYHDEKDDEAYIAWCRAWIAEIHRVLKPSGSFWLAIGDEYAAELKVAAQHQIGFATRSWVVWYYTFGVNCKNKFSRSHVHLFHFVKDAQNFTFNAEDPLVRVPSARALVYGDKRANPTGRLPDDTWIVRPAADDSWVLRPQDLPDGFQPSDDTWYYARVAGTFKERQGFHGCQMPEQLLGRIVRVSSNAGDVVLDPFAGSGTTLAVAKKLGRNWIGCELSEEYARAATERINSICSGDGLDGPADPIASAPSTANGRKLKGWETNPADADDPRDTASDSTIASAEDERDDRNREEDTARPEEMAEQPGALAEPVARDEVAKVAVADDASSSPKQSLRDLVREAIVESFFQTHQNFSTDWLLANPELQSAFHDACRDTGLIGGPANWNRELLRLRKAGAIPKRGELKKVQLTAEDMDGYSFAAEIAWRLASDQHVDSSLDDIFCDPEKADVFDRAARRFVGGVDAAHIRWAALRLRKSSKAIVDEVKQFHFVFAKRDFGSFQSWSKLKPTRYAGQAAIYMLRDKTKRPLYIGLALDLGKRLGAHQSRRATNDAATNISLIAGDELPGAEYLDAFKAELVRRHEPRWNMNLVGLSRSDELG